MWKEARKRTCSPRIWFWGVKPPAGSEQAASVVNFLAAHVVACLVDSCRGDVTGRGEEGLWEEGEKGRGGTDLNIVGSVGELAPVLRLRQGTFASVSWGRCAHSHVTCSCHVKRGEGVGEKEGGERAAAGVLE